MSSGHKRDMAASVRDRLLIIARQTGRNYESLLILYGLERFLFRLSRSAYRDRLVLKGGLLLMGLGIPQARITRDLDLLGLFFGSIDEVSEIIRSIGKIREDDDLSYDFSKLTAEQVAGNEDYPGVRIKFGASLKQARIAHSGHGTDPPRRPQQ